MYRAISSKIDYPQWAGTADRPSRWRRLDQMDRLLDGCFYDHLQYSFYREVDGGGEPVLLEDRRPSSQYHLPRMVAQWSSRKLWTGRHVPRVGHRDDTLRELVSSIVETTNFHCVMGTATILGSVGSVAVVFKIAPGGTGDAPQVSLRVWRAKECTPSLDEYGNLTSLLVHYNVRGSELISRGLRVTADGDEVFANTEYWWLRCYGTNDEVTYRPAKVEDWNPVQGWVAQGVDFVEHERMPHDLGFVPAVWIRNLPGCLGVDGLSTWQDAIDNSIEIDYLLSQASRGTRYNCAPELVVVGEMMSGEITARSTASYIHLRGAFKQENGDHIGAGSAHLLEMSGQGVAAARDLIDKLRNIALEQIGATRKDPEKLKGVMSGRAMEFLDEESHDLVMSLRTSYGGGALELLRKVVRALGSGSSAAAMVLNWPRLYQPTPEDLAHLIPALAIAATPIQEPLDLSEHATVGSSGGANAGTGTSSGAQKGAGTSGGRPSGAKGGKILGSLLTVEEAAAFLRMNMDIDLLPDADEDGVSDSDEPVGGSEVPPRLGTTPSRGDG